MRWIQNFIIKLSPMTKLLFFFTVIVFAFLIPGWQAGFTAFGLFVLMAVLLGRFKEYSTLLYKLAVLVFFIMVIQSFFRPGTDILWTWKFLSIKQEGVTFALNLSSKILAIGGGIGLFFIITKIKDFIYALEKAGMPPTLAYIVLAALQMIPQMKKRLLVIMDAQKTRGVETQGNFIIRTKAIIPILIPLILSSISATEEKAITLESRAFTASNKKQYLYSMEDSQADKILKSVFVLAMVSGIVWRSLSWILYR